MIIFSPIIIVLCVLAITCFILYLPIDLIIYLFKYKNDKYELLISLKRYKDNKERKKLKENNEEASQA